MKDKEKWMELCEQAATEQDSDKLLKLIAEIDRLLAEKGNRLKTSEQSHCGEKL
jgi:hypothetical protein